MTSSIKKALTATAIASALVLSACGSDTEEAPTTDATVEETTEEATDEPTEDVTEEETEEATQEPTEEETTDSEVAYGDPITVEETVEGDSIAVTMVERGITLNLPSGWTDGGLSDDSTTARANAELTQIVGISELGAAIGAITPELYYETLVSNLGLEESDANLIGEVDFGGIPAFKVEIMAQQMNGYTYYFEKDGIAYEATAIGADDQEKATADQVLNQISFN